MSTYFRAETDVAQNLIDDFFSNFDCQKTLSQEGFQVKKILGYGAIFWKKTEALHAEFNKRVEAATSSYSPAVDIILYF